MARKNFNSQPHKEADKAEGYAYNDMEHFNSQPHKEADIRKEVESMARKNFNSQPHKEADCTEVITMTREQAFQLTASQGG